MVQAANWVELLEHRAGEADPGLRLAFLDDPGQEPAALNARELFARAVRLAGHLQARAKAGERVLLLHPPGLDYVLALYGCFLAGMLAVPAYPLKGNRSADRLVKIVRDCQPVLALTSRQTPRPAPTAADQNAALEQLPWLHSEDLEQAAPPPWKRPEVKPDDPALLQYTSGSTGDPRGVVVTHANLLHNVAAIQERARLTPADIGLCWLPPYHDMGLIGGILLPVFVGGPVYLLSPVRVMQDPACWLSAISRYSITVSGGPNFAYDWCVRKIPPAARAGLNLSRWRVAFCGAEPVRAATLEAFSEAFAPAGFQRSSFFPTYGLAEATLMVSGGGEGVRPQVLQAESEALADHRVVLPASGPAAALTRLVGCGAPLADQRLAIVDPHTGLRCPPDRIGEIWVCGPSVTAGYFHKPQETRHAFGARLADDPSGPSFLRTGDLGFVHHAELFVTGRLKDLIIVRGRNIYPHDLEEAAGAVHPRLRRGFGIAFAIESESEPQIVLVQEVERACAPREMPAIVGAIRGLIADEFEIHVDRVVLVPPLALPRTSSGKLQRSACRAQYLSGTLKVLAEFNGSDPTPASGQPAAQGPCRRTPEPLQSRPCPAVEEIAADLQCCVAAQLRLPVGAVSLAQPLYPLGLDSLMVISVKAHIYQRWGVDLSIDTLDQSASVLSLAERVRRLRETGPVEGGEPRAAWTPDPARPAGRVRARIQAFTLPDQARAAGLMPFFREIESNDGPTCRIQGREVLMFGSNNYLGLTTDPRVRAAAAEAARTQGSSLTGSRLLNGSTPQQRRLERKLAGFLGHPDTLLFTTGYQAVAGTVSALLNPESTLLADAHAHASILDGAAIARCRLLTFRHNDAADLALRLQELADRSPVLVAVDGVYSMLGDLAPLPEILDLCRQYGADLLVDDAHGLGVLGPGGQGAEAHFGLSGQTILCGTFSKSLASIGGFVAGDERLLDWIRFHARPLLFSAAIPPPAVAAAEAALDILVAEPQRVETLRGHARDWRAGLAALGFNIGPSQSATVPVLVGDEKTCVAFSQALLEAGVFVNPVLPPAVPAGSALIRTSVMATHTRAQLDRALRIFADVGRKWGLCPAADQP